MESTTLAPMVTTGFLDTVNDQYPGGGDSPGAVQGQVGKAFQFDTPPASATTLYPGKYRYVKTLAASSATPIAGLIAYWSDKSAGIVTPDDPTNEANVAGIYIGTQTKGYHCFIKTTGDAVVKFKASTTKATPAVGDRVSAGGGAGVADVLADATAVTEGTAEDAIGTLVAAVAATLGRVALALGDS